uniref:Uncharacterized protein n=1 Tax=Aegilops tauschii subsp. strangulata TaxID=200361 RepID=A0A453DJB6_AEGTS
MAPKEQRLHADLFKVTHQKVVDAIRANIPNQTSYDQIKIIQLSCEPTDEELLMFYAEVHNHLLEVASLSINKNVDFFAPEEGFAEGFVPEIAEGLPVLRPQTKRIYHISLSSLLVVLENHACNLLFAMTTCTVSVSGCCLPMITQKPKLGPLLVMLTF